MDDLLNVALGIASDFIDRFMQAMQYVGGIFSQKRH